MAVRSGHTHEVHIPRRQQSLLYMPIYLLIYPLLTQTAGDSQADYLAVSSLRVTSNFSTQFINGPPFYPRGLKLSLLSFYGCFRPDKNFSTQFIIVWDIACVFSFSKSRL